MEDACGREHASGGLSQRYGGWGGCWQLGLRGVWTQQQGQRTQGKGGDGAAGAGSPPVRQRAGQPRPTGHKPGEGAQRRGKQSSKWATAWGGAARGYRQGGSRGWGGAARPRHSLPSSLEVPSHWSFAQDSVRPEPGAGWSPRREAGLMEGGVQLWDPHLKRETGWPEPKGTHTTFRGAEQPSAFRYGLSEGGREGRRGWLRPGHRPTGPRPTRPAPRTVPLSCLLESGSLRQCWEAKAAPGSDTPRPLSRGQRPSRDWLAWRVLRPGRAMG